MRAGILGSIRRQRDAGGHSRHAGLRGSGKYYSLEESKTSFAASINIWDRAAEKRRIFPVSFEKVFIN